MTDTLDLRPALQFLSRLKKNNDREWFQKNKDQYEQAMARFESSWSGGSSRG